MKSQLKELKQLVVGLTLIGCMAASSVAAEPTTSQTAPPADARQQLIALEKDWVAAENKHDAAALRRILDERFVVTFGSAKTYDREAFIGLFTGPVDPTESQTLTYEAIVIDHDTAVLVGTETAHGTKGGAAYTAIYKYTVTYILRHGQWLALAEHIVKVPQAT
jgi:ketosteroid isomerase-like protein